MSPPVSEENLFRRARATAQPGTQSISPCLLRTSDLSLSSCQKAWPWLLATHSVTSSTGSQSTGKVGCCCELTGLPDSPGTLPAWLASPRHILGPVAAIQNPALYHSPGTELRRGKLVRFSHGDIARKCIADRRPGDESCPVRGDASKHLPPGFIGGLHFGKIDHREPAIQRGLGCPPGPLEICGIWPGQTSDEPEAERLNLVVQVDGQHVNIRDAGFTHG